MHQFSLLPFLIPSILSLTFSLSQAQYHQYSNCAPIPYTCGDVQFTLGYPFRSGVRPNYCGHPSFFLDCINKNSTLAISISNKLYSVRQVDTINKLLTIANPNFTGQSCPETYKNTTIDATLFEYVDDRDRNLTIYYNCTASSGIPLAYYVGCVLDIVRNSYYSLDNGSASSDVCQSTVVIPMSSSAAGRLESGNASLGAALTEGFVVRWLLEGGWCPACVGSGGLCGYNQSVVDGNTCFCPDGPVVDSCPYLGSDNEGGGTGKIIAAVVAAVGGFIFACALCLYCYRRKKRRQVLSSTLVFGVSSTKNSFGKDPEFGRADYQTHIFSYSELQDATDHFDSSQELGDGGFGTVYKGKLKDGRTVAVKRLYDNNYKRVEQFINEVAILSNLRHQNLVTLYGCTSHQTRELLLVYEFVSNGTLADHLHGPRAPERVLTWPLRMRVAIETAEALAYLHAVEPPIIHRDVKTNNILLDESFHVKVADFGLSRLVPADATHVSTAPQGTPGYLDPEYHQCYQLTDKSDVYSFGVVLVELISSKTAVDVNRGRNEINLATMALSRIQRKELDGLVDPELGYHSNLETKRMILVVAELAFRCLQMDRDMRPPIKEVLDMLRDLQSGECKVAGVGEADDRRDVVGLLRKSSLSFSPDSTEKWSRSTTSNSSG